MVNLSYPLPEVLLDPETEFSEWESAWKALRNKRWFLLTVAALVFSISTIYQLSLPNIYTAEAALLLERVKDTPLHYEEMLFSVPDNESYYSTRIALLRSRPILEKAIDTLNLTSYYGGTGKAAVSKERAFQLLRQRISAERMRGTQIMKIRVVDTQPQMAEKIADAVLNNFVEESWRQRFFISRQILERLSGDGKNPAEGEKLQSAALQAGTDEIIDLLPSVATNPAISELRQQERGLLMQQRELSKRYTEIHPKMKEIRERLAYVEMELTRQTEKVIRSLKAGLSGEFSVSSIEVVERPSIPSSPSGPVRFRFVLLATLVSTVLGMVGVILSDHYNRTIREAEDLKKVSSPFLGYVPRIPEMNGKSGNGKAKNFFGAMVSDARLADEVTNVRASILFSTPADRGRFLMCTSAMPEEGKTTIAAMLSLSLAEAGEKVLLIDADMRKPSVHKTLGIENEAGLSNCLAGACSFRDCIRPIEQSPNLNVITAGEKTPNPVILLDSSQTDRLLEELGEEYDRIIFDTPPALHMADALVLARRMHGTILVFGVGEIHQSVAKKLTERIRSAKGVVIGSVINRVDYQKLNYPYYRLYHRYSKYYQSRRVLP